MGSEMCIRDRLFGEDVSKILSIYEHKHDHKHGVDGSVEEN